MNKNRKCLLLSIVISLTLSIISTHKFILEKGYIYLAEQFEVRSVDQFLKVVYPLWNDKIQSFSIADFSKIYLYTLLVYLSKFISFITSFDSYKILQLLALASPIAIAYFSAFLLSSYIVELFGKVLTIDKKYRCLISLVVAYTYVVNPLVVTHPRNIILRFGYAAFPLVVYLSLKILKEKSLAKIVLYSFYLDIILSIFFGIRLLILAFLTISLIYLLYMIFTIRLIDIKKSIYSYFILILLFILINIPKILSILLYYKSTYILASKAMSLEMIKNEPLLSLFAFWPHNFIGFRFNSPYYDYKAYLFLIITISGLIYIFFINKLLSIIIKNNGLKFYRFLLFMPIILIIIIFGLFSKEIGNFIMFNIIKFSPSLARLLRHSDRSIIIALVSINMSLSYSLIIIISYLKNKINKKIIKYSIICIIIGGLIILSSISAWPMFTGDMNGYWTPSPVPSDYVYASCKLMNTERFHHIIWFPLVGGVRAIWSHQRGPFDVSAPTGIFELRSSPVSGYYQWYVYPLYYYSPVCGGANPLPPCSIIYTGNKISNILKIFNIKYIGVTYDRIWPYYYRKNGVNNDYLRHVASSIANRYNNMRLLFKGKYLSLFEVVGNSSQVFSAPLAFCDCLIPAFSSIDYIYVNKRIYNYPLTLIFPYLNNKNYCNLLHYSSLIISTYKTVLIPLAVTCSNNKYVIYPANYALSTLMRYGWVRGQPFNYYHVRNLYKVLGSWNWPWIFGDSLAYTLKKNATLEINVYIKHSSYYSLFARVLESIYGGILAIYIDGKEHFIVTKSNDTILTWRNIGPIFLNKGKHNITIVNINGFNAINVLALIPTNEYMKTLKIINNIILNKTIVYIYEPEFNMEKYKAQVIIKRSASNGKIVALGQGGFIRTVFETINDNYYIIMIRFKGNISLIIDNSTVNLYSSRLSFKYTGPIYLRKGIHILRIISKNNLSYIDIIVLYSLLYKNNIIGLNDLIYNNISIICSKRINSGHWKVFIKSSKPFVLVFTDLYSPLWNAYVYKNGKLVEKAHSIRVFGVLNGFIIRSSGNLVVDIYFEPQRVFIQVIRYMIILYILLAIILFYKYRYRIYLWMRYVIKRIQTY